MDLQLHFFSESNYPMTDINAVETFLIEYLDARLDDAAFFARFDEMLTILEDRYWYRCADLASKDFDPSTAIPVADILKNTAVLKKSPEALPDLLEMQNQTAPINN